MIPYIYISPISFGSVTLWPFGILVAAAVLVGVKLALWRSRRLAMEPHETASFIRVILIGGFVGAHVFAAIFYSPREVLNQPWLLLEFWNGLSSFGGFLGALLGALIWKYYERREVVNLGRFHLVRPTRRKTAAAILPFADVIMAVFPVSWFLGRVGCAIVHDHPGIRAPDGSWLAVAFGPGPVEHFWFIGLRYGTQPRYDLGLLEMVFAALLAVGFALTWRCGRANGWYVVAASIIYAPVRFVLDFLRIADPVIGDMRYGGLTPAQWACFLLFAFGLVLGIRIRRRNKVRTS